MLINGTGRTDFQNGSSKDAYNSLFNKLLKLPEILCFIQVMIITVNLLILLEMKNQIQGFINNADEYAEIMSNLNLSKPELMDSNIKVILN